MANLSGKTVLITGANKGIGFCTALALAKLQAKIIMVDKEDLSNSKGKIVDATGNTNIVEKFADFSSLNSVKSLAQQINTEEQSLNVLINNVGVFCGGKGRSEDGLQRTMQINHFGPFLLSILLEGLLKKSAPSRMIFVSSLGAFFHSLTPDNINDPDLSSWDPVSTLLIYYNSKLCNMIAANGFSRRLVGSGVTANSLHPGMTRTEFLMKKGFVSDYLLKYFTQDVDVSARGSILLASSQQLEGTTGQFFVNCKPHEMPHIAQDSGFCQRIWNVSEFYVGVGIPANLEDQNVVAAR